MNSQLIVKRAKDPDGERCFQIRREVFIEEQNVPEELEFDEYDATALHFIAFNCVKDKNHAVATATVLIKEDGKTAKIGRVAVLKQARGMGVGKQLMQEIERSPELANVTNLILEAQTHAVSFYEKLGYRAQGDEFMDVGIPHFRMIKIVA